jgi:hypothetical protein
MDWEAEVSQAGPQPQPVSWHPQVDVVARIEAEHFGLRLSYHGRAYRRASVKWLADRMLEILMQLSREGTG